MKVEGINATRSSDGSIIYNEAVNSKRKTARHINEQDKYIKSLEKRLIRLENLVQRILKEQ